MTIPKRMSVSLELTEQIQSSVAGRPVVALKHAMPIQDMEPVYAVWSQELSIDMGPPVSFPLNALQMPNLANPRDLYTGQELRLFALEVKPTSQLGTLTVYRDQDIMVTYALEPDLHVVMRCGLGHLYGQHVDRFEFMPLGGALAVDIILATVQEAS